MYISYIRIKNFRNFRNLEVELSRNAIIVGENTVGKSNFLEALRLILDPSLPDQSRNLTKDDFWAGDPESSPAYKGTVIEIAVRIAGLDETLLSFLHDSTVPHNPAEVAEICYRFEPNPRVELQDRESAGPSQYTFNFYTPKKPIQKLFQEIPDDEFYSLYRPVRSLGEIRKRLILQVIPALRDIENSISSWRRSPLRQLVERLKLEEDPKFSESVGKLEDASITLREAPGVDGLEGDLQKRLGRMLGGMHDVAPRLNFVTLDESVLSRSLRLYVDGEAWRSIGSTSLGIANVLHLALLTLDSEKRKVEDNEFVVLAVEEPEAHLHPHFQRLVFRDYFQLAEDIGLPTLVTTHSPHITSVAPLESVVLIKSEGAESCAVSTANSLSGLSEREKNDLKRYLDVTRSEILFARGVILVEGPAEAFLLHAFVREMPELIEKVKPVDGEATGQSLQNEFVSLDQFGVTVCDIGGVGFKPYVKYLTALRIPFVVLTDGDRYRVEEERYKYRGLERAIGLLEITDQGKASELLELYEDGKMEALKAELKSVGVFVNEQTLEAELLLSGCESEFAEAFAIIGAGSELQAKIRDWVKAFIDEHGAGQDADEALGEIIGRIDRYPCYGKGRFAQALAERVDYSKMPVYLSEAVLAIINQV